MSISRIYELGKRSLLAYQSAINTTAKNISNVNNENYTRRRADLSQLSAGFSGLGINHEQALRLRQQFAEHQIWQENQLLGKYEMRYQMLSQVENVFAEGTEASLSNVLNEFWNAWNDLANDPESDFARNLVKDKASVLSNTFQRLHSDLKNMQEQILPEIKTQVSEINQITSELLSLNKRMRTGSTPELMDQRDQIINELSSKLNIKVKEKENGEVSIYADGYLLVSDETRHVLETEVSEKSGNYFATIKLQKSDHALTINSGKLAGLLDVHNKQIPHYLKQLDQLAGVIADEVNQLHRQGENLLGSSGINFFADHINGAADFRLNEAILNDRALIASRMPGEGEGSGSLAQRIGDLQFKSMMNSGTTAEFYNAMLSNLGSDIRENKFLEESQSLIVQELKNHRDETAGVSLDEEMMRLVQFEQAYQAAARIITTVDEMAQTVLNLK